MKRILIAFIAVSLAFLGCESPLAQPSSNYRKPENYYIYKIPYRRVEVSEFKHKGHVYLYVIGEDVFGASVLHSQSCPCLNK